MSQLFTQDFIKFLTGFLVVITLSLVFILMLQSAQEEPAEPNMQTIPATTTSDQP